MNRGDHQLSMGPLVLGGTGRVGRLLQAVWPQAAGGPVLWHQRQKTDTDPDEQSLIWDMAMPPPPVPRPVSAVICLAGVTTGDARALAANTALALAACDLGARLAVPVLLASSQAVYGRDPGPASERDAPHPATPYGVAKLAMERAVAARDGVTCLRIGNVAGADSLLLNAARGPVTLDRFADGQGPRRAYIGPVGLARVLAALAGRRDLPPVLNVAAPGLVAMADLVRAADVRLSWRDAPDTALPELALDLTLLAGLVPLTPVTAADLVAEARRAGWGA